MTARDDLTAKQRGFSAGVDDYMVKPVDLDELFAADRRAAAPGKDRQQAKSLTVRQPLCMDADEHTAYLNGEEIPLTVREFNLLYKLLSYPKKTFTRAQLMEEFWEMDNILRPADGGRIYHQAAGQIFRLRPDFEIVTVHGLGYKAVLK